MNFINKADPINVSRTLELEAAGIPQVYTPFNAESAQVEATEKGCTITLPEKCAYAVLFYKK